MTPRRRRFVDEYVKDFDAAHAAIRAGFARASAASYGSYLLRQPDIAAALEARLHAHDEACRAAADRVVAELAAIAFSDIRDYASWSKGKLAVKPRGRIAPSRAAAIADIVPGGASGVRIRLQRKKRALKALARHVGLFETRAYVDPQEENAAAARLRARLAAETGVSFLGPEAKTGGEGR